ncbi:MAG: TIGR02996 domain-containing protein [Kofleriaceae bacterium]
MGGGATRGNPALEQAIVAAPDDPAPRMVYGDWFQLEGDPIGEWVAMSTAVELRPDDVPLKSAAIAWRTEHRTKLFGKATAGLAGSYFGWRGGFIDELRLQQHPKLTLAMVVELFANPLLRFVRHIAIANIKPPLPKVIDALVAAKFPLLDELVVVDSLPEPMLELDVIATLPLKKLALSKVKLSTPMPSLRELVVFMDFEQHAAWIERCPNLERVIAIDISEPAKLSTTVPVEYMSGEEYVMVADNEFRSSVEPFVHARDRATLRMFPGAGEPIHALGFHYLDTDLTRAKQFLELAVTLPVLGQKAFKLNAAIANERLGDAVRAELYARDALADVPGDEGFYEILIDALRQQKRYDDAFALFPKAMAAIRKPKQTDGRDRACLLDLMLTYTLAGKTDEAIALVEKFSNIIADEHRALVAIIYLQRGDTKRAKAMWRQVGTKKASAEGLIHHARALFALEQGKPEIAREAVRAAWDAHYTDMAWLAQDKRLAKYVPKKRKVKS